MVSRIHTNKSGLSQFNPNRVTAAKIMSDSDNVHSTSLFHSSAIEQMEKFIPRGVDYYESQLIDANKMFVLYHLKGAPIVLRCGQFGFDKHISQHAPAAVLAIRTAHPHCLTHSFEWHISGYYYLRWTSKDGHCHYLAFRVTHPPKGFSTVQLWYIALVLNFKSTNPNFKIHRGGIVYIVFASSVRVADDGTATGSVFSAKSPYQAAFEGLPVFGINSTECIYRVPWSQLLIVPNWKDCFGKVNWSGERPHTAIVFVQTTYPVIEHLLKSLPTVIVKHIAGYIVGSKPVFPGGKPSVPQDEARALLECYVGLVGYGYTVNEVIYFLSTLSLHILNQLLVTTEKRWQGKCARIAKP